MYSRIQQSMGLGRVKEAYRYILRDLYGVESRFTQPGEDYISMEEIEEELNANMVIDYGMEADNPFADIAGGTEDNVNTEDDLVQPDVEGAEPEEEEPLTAGEPEEVPEPEPEDTMSVMEIMGTYQKSYIVYLKKSMMINKDLVIGSGKFADKANGLYKQFVEPTFEILELVYKDDEKSKIISDLRNLVIDKDRMKAIMGEPDNPFIGEGLQILLYLLLYISLALTPKCVQTNTKLAQAVTEAGDVVERLFEIAKDIVEVKGLFGGKIIYQKPTTSEITKRNYKVEGSPLEKSKLFLGNPQEVLIAHESFNNLLAIRNNKCLVEFSMIIKGLNIVAALVADVDLKNRCVEALSRVKLIIDSKDQDVDKTIEEAEKYFEKECVGWLTERFSAITSSNKGDVEDPKMDMDPVDSKEPAEDHEDAPDQTQDTGITPEYDEAETTDEGAQYAGDPFAI